ncbi:MAG: DUF5360 family protein [Pseudomonadota bacterium]
MPVTLRTLFLLTDIGFIAYWSLTAIVSVGWLHLPSEWLFKDYNDPNIIAWNWSFMPLDILASLTGLYAVARASRNQDWQTTALISMTLTFCAGFMAICFWIVQGSFDLAWWGPNLFLMLWPLVMARHALGSV